MIRADSPSWIAAKAEGDSAELALAEWFRRHGWAVFKTLGRESFDLLLQCPVEVKHDRRAAETGNVAVEVSHNGQPSGIVTTTATWWAFVLGAEAVVVKTEALRTRVLTGRFREVPAGDGKASRVVLLPVATLKGIKGAGTISMGGSDAAA